MGFAVDQVKEQVDLVRNLPATAETPEIGRIINYEPIASVLIAGPDDPRGLRSIVRRFERELLERGISNIRIFGLPEEEIAIQIPSETLREVGLSLEDIGRRVGAASRDLPVGVIGRGESAQGLGGTQNPPQQGDGTETSRRAQVQRQAYRLPQTQTEVGCRIIRAIVRHETVMVVACGRISVGCSNRKPEGVRLGL